MLQPISMSGALYNITDIEKFNKGIALIKDSLFDKGATLFCSDNIITWNKSLSFLRDEYFLDILNGNKHTVVEKGILWRTYTLLYFAQYASNAEGDFLELGCHTGSTASLVLEKVNFSALAKKYYLYDVFEWKEGDGHTHLDGHNNPKMYEDVLNKFSKFDFVKIIKGTVPQSFRDGFPDKIAFAHLDMNHPDPEVGAMKAVLPRLAKGAAIILDDYGWWGYSDQKIALDPIIKEHGLSVLELPTGQGLILK